MTQISTPVSIEFENRTRADNSCSEDFKFDVEGSEVLSSISVKYSRLPNHGAPCSISFSGNEGNDRKLHNFVKNVSYDISHTSDDIPHLSSEGKMDMFRRNFKVSSEDVMGGNITYKDVERSKHNVCSGWGDEPSAGFDRIAPENVLNVLRKSLQVAVNRDVIDHSQAEGIMSNMTSSLITKDPEVRVGVELNS